jgi:hypothetical protein
MYLTLLRIVRPGSSRFDPDPGSTRDRSIRFDPSFSGSATIRFESSRAFYISEPIRFLRRLGSDCSRLGSDRLGSFATLRFSVSGITVYGSEVFGIYVVRYSSVAYQIGYVSRFQQCNGFFICSSLQQQILLFPDRHIEW